MGIYTSKQKPEDEKAQVLLLGIGCSGKSTLLKQLKLENEIGFSAEEKELYLTAIYKNTFTELRSQLYKLANNPAVRLDYSLNADFIEQIIKVNVNSFKFDSLPFSLEIKSLLEDSGVLKATSFSPYFLDLVRRLSAKFELGTEDILGCHLPTVRPNVVPFCIKGLNFNVVDVGGSMNERFGWKQHFVSSHVIVWMVDIHEYDTPRLAAALHVFEETVNQHDMINKPVVLVFSKYDLLVEKLATNAPHVSFPDYKGPQKVDSFTYFVWTKFRNADKHVGTPRLHRSTSSRHHLITTLIYIISDNHPRVQREAKSWQLMHKEIIEVEAEYKRKHEEEDMAQSSSEEETDIVNSEEENEEISFEEVRGKVHEEITTAYESEPERKRVKFQMDEKGECNESSIKRNENDGVSESGLEHAQEEQVDVSMEEAFELDMEDEMTEDENEVEIELDKKKDLTDEVHFKGNEVEERIDVEPENEPSQSSKDTEEERNHIMNEADVSESEEVIIEEGNAGQPCEQPANLMDSNEKQQKKDEDQTYVNNVDSSPSADAEAELAFVDSNGKQTHDSKPTDPSNNTKEQSEENMEEKSDNIDKPETSNPSLPIMNEEKQQEKTTAQADAKVEQNSAQYGGKSKNKNKNLKKKNKNKTKN